ncbi:hypothetical protein EV177_008516 [Coemansia sp. RSA 1804]|nr:hypothetical protein EV177_008516 [Coemansia sp. RSA 1804]
MLRLFSTGLASKSGSLFCTAGTRSPLLRTTCRGSKRLAGFQQQQQCRPQTQNLVKGSRWMSTRALVGRDAMNAAAKRSPLWTGKQAQTRLRGGQQWRGARWDQYTNANYGERRGWKLTPEVCVYTIIAINGLVFVMWIDANGKAKSFGDLSKYKWMASNFTINLQSIREGRVWTLVTAAFSHVEPMHLLVNMFVLHQFGTDIARILGTRRFVGFYLGAAVIGNAVSLLIRGFVLPYTTGDSTTAGQMALGASTSVVGTTTLFACLFPQAELLLFFIVPVRAWMAATGFIAWDLWRVMQAKSTRVDGAGHLGGALAALGYYWVRLRPHIRRMR